MIRAKEDKRASLVRGDFYSGLRRPTRLRMRGEREDRRGSLVRGDFYSGLRRPTRLRMRRTFFGEIDSRDATRETFLPSRSHTLGMTSSANSSLICWNVRLPSAPSDQARNFSSTLALRTSLALSACN